MKKIYLTLLLGFLSFSLFSQQTVGLFTYDTLGTADGYTLFAPFSGTSTYLINNCGHLVKKWESDYRPGANSYLTPDGSLLRSGFVFSEFAEAGGCGGILEKFNWDGERTWYYEIGNDSFSQHHDFKQMPNGNILVLVWEKISKDTALANGRDEMLIMGEQIWSEKIIEIKPKANNSAEIVWEWRAMDHLVQDKFPTKKNYGSISQHPELIDFNSSLISNQNDWLHFNSVDYNADLDQIVISCHAYSEIYIIDHSTNMDESSGHFGGNHNNGGDLIYRWGNPQAYGRGSSNDRTCFKQHDAHWIEKGYPDAGKIMFFNNGTERKYSTVEIINPPVKPTTNEYQLEPNKAYLPESPEWQYPDKTNTAFFSTNMAGVQRLKNGNSVICESTKGKVFEIDNNKKIVWSYVQPMVAGGPTEQGTQAIGNNIFRALKYPSDYSGFKNKNMPDGKPLELNYIYQFCDDTTTISNPGDTTSSGILSADKDAYNIYPNPAREYITVQSPIGRNYYSSFKILELSGKDVLNGVLSNDKTNVDISGISSGFYLFVAYDSTGTAYNTIKLYKE